MIGICGCADYEEDLLDEISQKQVLATAMLEIMLADDDYNQGIGHPSRCYDQIKMSQFVVNFLGSCRTWNDFESALRKYTGAYFTESQINEFLFLRAWPAST